MLFWWQLSKFAALTEDGVWGVRKACAESFVQVASSCSMHMRKTQLVPLFLGLVNDQSRWVRSAMFLHRLTGLFIEGKLCLSYSDIVTIIMAALWNRAGHYILLE